ncbi:copper resistance CopC family protein [Microbacterium hominis]|uniref:copper resistance CopC family protein n=1 Tax=Microbacterium hominis TaxID=162426 RepID=UPI0020B7CE84|nr:copper resistance CopC family protein [Microbacterium hominis]
MIASSSLRSFGLRPLTAVAAALVALALATAGVLTTASPARAHDELIGSSPAADATVDGLPGALVLTFSDEIADDDGASEVQVTAPDGTALTAGRPTASDNTLTQPLSGDADGTVTVLWKVVSSDGHPISGEFAFTVAPATTPTAEPTATAEPTPTETAEPVPGETAEPTATPAPEDTAATAPAWPWILLGVLGVAVVGAVVYLLVTRGRPGNSGGAGTGSQPDSDTPADR